MAVNFFGALHVSDAPMQFMAPGGRILMAPSGLGELSCLSPDRQDELTDPNLTRGGLTALVNHFEVTVEAGQSIQADPASCDNGGLIGIGFAARQQS